MSWLTLIKLAELFMILTPNKNMIGWAELHVVRLRCITHISVSRSKKGFALYRKITCFFLMKNYFYSFFFSSSHVPLGTSYFLNTW